MEIKQIHVEIIQFFFYFRFTNILTLNTGLSHYKQNINNFKIKSFAHLFIRQCYMKVYRCNDFTSLLILFTALEKSVQFDPQYSDNAGFRQFLLLGELAYLPFWPKKLSSNQIFVMENSPLDRKDHGWVLSVWEQLSVVQWSVFFVCVNVPVRFLDIPFSILGAALTEQCPHYNMYKFTLLLKLLCLKHF